MTCPPGLEPFRFSDGEPMPLFVPEAMLTESRRQSPKLWIEPMPELPYSGRAITHADWQGVLQDSSKSA